jgi:hypothetical protein
VGSTCDVVPAFVFDMVELPSKSSSAFFVLVLEESGAMVDSIALPSTVIPSSLSAASEMDVTGLTRGSRRSRDVEGIPVGGSDAELALTLTAGSKSAMPAHT